jgi:hypothetical protein
MEEMRERYGQNVRGEKQGSEIDIMSGGEMREGNGHYSRPG